MRDFSIKDLVGKKIKSVDYNESRIIFIGEDTAYTFEAVGDCCSHSFIEDMDNPEIFKDSVVLEAESVSGDKEEITDYEVSKWTFYKFKTTKGNCTLSFRNDSNGYYNGELQFVGGH